MRRKESIYEKLKELDKGKGVSARKIAEDLGLRRANVSSDLNRLVDEKKVI